MTEEAATFLGLGAGFGVFVVVVGIIWFILNVILFFKIWDMTNDMRELKNMFREQLDLEHPFVDDEEPAKENKT